MTGSLSISPTPMMVTFFSEWTRLVAKKSFIQTHLGLRAEVIMQTRKHNDYLISRIRGFYRLDRYSGWFSRLNMADHQTTPVPASFLPPGCSSNPRTRSVERSRVSGTPRASFLQAIGDIDASSATRVSHLRSAKG